MESCWSAEAKEMSRANSKVPSTGRQTCSTVVCKGSKPAKEDAWAHPQSEQLACVAASPAFKNGFECENRFAEAGDEFFNGDLGYHMRKGTHYFSREDWQKLIRFVNAKK